MQYPLNNFETVVYNSIMKKDKKQFAIDVIESDQQTHHDLTVIVRKFKILGMPLPDYIANLRPDEFDVAKKAKEALKKQSHPDLNALSDEEFEHLSLIVFRAMVQYF